MSRKKSGTFILFIINTLTLLKHLFPQLDFLSSDRCFSPPSRLKREKTIW